LKPEEIKAIREKENVSQTVFANLLERNQQPRQQMGAGRKAAFWSFA
jgi:DNA-binding transcriptional regulator YiaG